jgi:betaine-aldehyde dehydrogenase
LIKLSAFIDGHYCGNASSETYLNINPATARPICEVEVTSVALLEAAVRSSQKAYLIWSKTSPIERARCLQKAVHLLRKRNDELALVEVEDTGKPWQEASTVDVVTGADSIEYFAGLAPTQLGTQQSIGDDFFYTRQEPLGIIAGIGAWNYPLQIACWKAAPALAAGNVMIFKPSEETPRSATLLAEIFIEAGVPPGVFNVVHGDGKVGAWLTAHPEIAKVSFTGEVDTGTKVMASSAASLKSVTMELGGKSPLIIFEDAALNQAVLAAMVGNFYTQGEVCTNGTRVFVHRSIYDAFIILLTEKIKSGIKAGDPKDPDTNFGSLISGTHLEKVLHFIEKGIEEGAQLLLGGHRIETPECINGFFIEPTVFIDCHDDMSICQHEIFGPVMSVLVFDDESEVIRRANSTKYGLAAGIFTKDIQRAHRVVQQLEAGICWINQYGVSPVEMPVGGYKSSGIGRENGVETLNAYTQTKSIYVGLTSMETPYEK